MNLLLTFWVSGALLKPDKTKSMLHGSRRLLSQLPDFPGHQQYPKVLSHDRSLKRSSHGGLQSNLQRRAYSFKCTTGLALGYLSIPCNYLAFAEPCLAKDPFLLNGLDSNINLCKSPLFSKVNQKFTRANFYRHNKVRSLFGILL